MTFLAKDGGGVSQRCYHRYHRRHYRHQYRRRRRRHHHHRHHREQDEAFTGLLPPGHTSSDSILGKAAAPQAPMAAMDGSSGSGGWVEPAAAVLAARERAIAAAAAAAAAAPSAYPVGQELFAGLSAPLVEPVRTSSSELVNGPPRG